MNAFKISKSLRWFYLKTKRSLRMLFFSFAISGCAHSIHTHQAGDYNFDSSDAKKLVKSTAEQLVVLNFAFDTNYVDDAYKKLVSQCASDISGIHTWYSTSLGFLSWTNKVHMSGYCHE